MDEILMHPFFADLDMTKLLQKKIEAPFVPVVRDKRDLTHFDREVTGQALAESILPATSI